MSAFDEDPREDQDEETHRQFAKLLSQRDRLLAVCKALVRIPDGPRTDECMEAHALIAEIEKENGK